MFPAAACRSSSPALRAFAPSAARRAPLISTGVWLTKPTFCQINDPRPFFGRDGDRCLIKTPGSFQKSRGVSPLTVLTKATPGYAGGEKELIARGGVDKKKSPS